MSANTNGHELEDSVVLRALADAVKETIDERLESHGDRLRTAIDNIVPDVHVGAPDMSPVAQALDRLKVELRNQRVLVTPVDMTPVAEAIKGINRGFAEQTLALKHAVALSAAEKPEVSIDLDKLVSTLEKMAVAQAEAAEAHERSVKDLIEKLSSQAAAVSRLVEVLAKQKQPVFNVPVPSVEVTSPVTVEAQDEKPKKLKKGRIRFDHDSRGEFADFEEIE